MLPPSFFESPNPYFTCDRVEIDVRILPILPLIYISSQTDEYAANNAKEREAFKDKLYLATVSRASKDI